MASIAEKPAPEAAKSEPSIEDRRALIERVAASEQFSRSARLRDFLLYVGRQSLKEGCPEIHEQEIGAKVFGRPESYDRASDNIVRVNATELRKRIESYFAQDGASEPLIFEIPRGAYKPVFHRRISEATVAEALGKSPQEAVAPAGTVNSDQSRVPGQIRRWIWPLLSLSLAIACVALYLENRTMHKALHPWEGQPALTAFWSGFLDQQRQTDLVLPDDSLSVTQDITQTPVTLDDYISRAFVRQVQSSNMSIDRKNDVVQVLRHNLLTFGAVRATQAVLGEIPATYPRYVTMARQFTPDEIKRDNVILIGGKKAVPWDDLVDDQLNFITDYDFTRGVAIVRNRHPKPGEQAVYSDPAASAVIAYMPNPSHTGNVIILAGTDSDATGAAAAFLTNEEQMEMLRKTLHADRFPYFEVLLKTSRLSGTFFNAELIAYRAYPNL